MLQYVALNIFFEWNKPTAIINFTNALFHSQHIASKLSSPDLKAHLKTTTILAKGLKAEMASVNAHNEKVRADIHYALSLHATTSQVHGLSKEIQALAKKMDSIMDALESKMTNVEDSL